VDLNAAKIITLSATFEGLNSRQDEPFIRLINSGKDGQVCMQLLITIGKFS